MKKLLSIGIILLLPILILAQTNYYVSPTGNNINTGDFANPWLEVQHGLDQIASGDTLNLMTGNYNEKLIIPISGLTLRNHTSNTPVLDGTGLTSQTSMIDIDNVSNIIIDGIEIRNNIMVDAQGIIVQDFCANITIQNCEIHEIHFSPNAADAIFDTTNAQGIIVFGYDGSNAITNLKILNNEMYDCRLGQSEGIAVNGNVDGFEVSGNLVHDITNIGIDAIGHEGTSSDPLTDQARNGVIKNNITHHCLSSYATSGGIYIDGGKLIVVENNTSYHNGYGVEIGCENLGKTTSDIVVRNNIFYDNEICAFAVGGFDFPTTTGKVINSSFRNNTCYFNDYLNDGVGEMYISYTEDCTIENNIFNASAQGVALYQDIASVNLVMNHNHYHTATAGGIEFNINGASSTNGIVDFNAATGFEANAVEINPIFVSPGIASPDFHLQSTSPAINAGNPSYTPAASEVDMDGETRTPTVDCGADEYFAPLSVEYLKAFNAQLSGYEVKLTWTTASEIDNKYFEIERSHNAKSWDKVQVIIAKSNSNSSSFYQEIDNTPLQGVSYYRLKQIDIDGTFSYSNIASVYFVKQDSYLYPNPTKGLFNIIFVQNENANITVLDLTGNTVLQSVFEGLQASIDLSHLPNGIYFVSVQTHTDSRVEKVILER